MIINGKKVTFNDRYNKRFMHGRRAYKKNDVRDIVNLQTSRASFGYGSSIRKTIKL